jgi:TM2 domain-containing membrane protein YozV
LAAILTSEATVNYYIAEGTTQRGPFLEQELQNAGLRPDQLVWREGMAQWLPAGQVPELQVYFTTSAAPAIPPIAYATPGYRPIADGAIPSDVNGKKMAAGLCGVVLGAFGLGGLGVHKFVLGLNSGGFTMLGITLGLLVLGFLTCGITMFAFPVMSIIGLVEGIIYLTKSDAEFYNLYLVQKRQWF